VSDLDAFKRMFLQESEDNLAVIEQQLAALGAGQPDSLDAVFRAVHSIKGGAGAFGWRRLVEFAHAYETLLDRLRAGRVGIDGDMLSLLPRAADKLADLLRAAAGGAEAPDGHEAQILAALRQAAGMSTPAAAPMPPAAHAPSAPAAAAAAPRRTPTTLYHIRFAPTADTLRSGNEPLLLLRELKRLGALDIETDVSALPDLESFDPEECYLSWRLTLDSPVGIQEVRNVFAFAEGTCPIEIEAAGPGGGLLIEADEGGDEAASPPDVAAAPAAAPAPIPASTAAPAEVSPAATDLMAAAGPRAVAAASTIRVDVDKVDRLVNMVGELVITQAMLAQQAAEIPTERHRVLVDTVEHLAQQTRDLQDAVMAIRALPMRHLFQRLPRLVREIGQQVGKSARLIVEGETVEVDRSVIEALGDPLTHLIRNAMDHGIEAPEQRRASGKPDEGTILVSAEHRSGRIMIEIADDGRGIDRKRVLAKAVERGLVQPGVALEEDEIDQIIFLPGFSTAEQVSDISGRGVGMDVVRRNINALGGRILVRSFPGEGTTLALILPLTLAVLDGMILRVGEEVFVLPIANIVESLRPEAGAVSTLVGTGEMIDLRGAYLRLIRLGPLFGIEGAVEAAHEGIVVIFETEDGNRAALLVDDLLGQRQVVIKSLEANFRQLPGVAAATILGDGQVALILDVAGLRLLDRARGGGGARTSRVDAIAQ
jgi:two-component system chemotaxis sensor kinase CheA